MVCFDLLYLVSKQQLITLQSTIGQRSMAGYIIGPAPLPIILLLGITAVEHAVQLVEIQGREHLLQGRVAHLRHVARAQSAHAVAELGHDLAHAQNGLFVGVV